MLGALTKRLRRLFARRLDRDGAGSALEPTHPVDASPPATVGRRDRLGVPAEMLDRALAQKVLQGWLGNRNQVLVPLTLRLGTLNREDVGVLMRFAAASLLAASEADEHTRGVVRRWLGTVGADAAAMVDFELGLRSPLAISLLFSELQARQLAAYGYAFAAVTADLRTASGRLYVDYVAARLALPADAVRSINRRYRR